MYFTRNRFINNLNAEEGEADTAGLITIMAAFLIPGLRILLGIVMLDAGQILLIIGFALVLLIFVEIGKAVANISF